MLEELERVRKREHRTRSELIREALRSYFVSRIPEAKPTQAELRAIWRGRAASRRQDGQIMDIDETLGLKRRNALKAHRDADDSCPSDCQEDGRSWMVPKHWHKLLADT